MCVTVLTFGTPLLIQQLRPRKRSNMENKNDALELRSQAAEIERLNTVIEAQWEDRQGPLKQAELYMRECTRLEKERDQLKARNEKLVKASKQAITSLEFFIHELGLKEQNDPHYTQEDYSALDAIKALKENT